MMTEQSQSPQQNQQPGEKSSQASLPLSQEQRRGRTFFIILSLVFLAPLIPMLMFNIEVSTIFVTMICLMMIYLMWIGWQWVRWLVVVLLLMGFLKKAGTIQFDLPSLVFTLAAVIPGLLLIFSPSIKSFLDFQKQNRKNRKNPSWEILLRDVVIIQLGAFLLKTTGTRQDIDFRALVGGTLGLVVVVFLLKPPYKKHLLRVFFVSWVIVTATRLPIIISQGFPVTVLFSPTFILAAQYLIGITIGFLLSYFVQSIKQGLGVD